MNKSDVKSFIIDNYQDYKNKHDSLLKDSLEAKNSNPYFRDEIEESMRGILERHIIDDLTHRLAIPAEDVYDVLDQFDVLDFLGGDL